jgi:hypothetical protein
MRNRVRFEVVVAGRTRAVLISASGEVSVDGTAIGRVELSGGRGPRRWRATSGNRTTGGYTATSAAASLVYLLGSDLPD